MRYFILSILVSIMFVYCNTSNNNESKIVKQTPTAEIEKTSIRFINKIVDFDTVSQDSVVISKFSLINTGRNKLIIKSVLPDCNCTDFELNRDTILPTDTCMIWLRLNTYNKYGSVKSYTILRVNTEEEVYKLTLKGYVIDAKQQE